MYFLFIVELLFNEVPNNNLLSTSSIDILSNIQSYFNFECYY